MGRVLWVGEHVCDQVHVIFNIIILHHKVTNDLMNYPRWGQLIDFQWQAMGMPICWIYAYLRGKHLFEEVNNFIF